MNKSAIQKFAMWARNELIAQVLQRAYQYGIEEDNIQNGLAETLGGRILSAEERIQRQELIQQIREKGYRQVMEEVAYTWFNRFIALRFMEVNNYLPSHIRVFSDASGAFKPEILNDVLHVDLPGLDLEKVETYVENNDTEALYRYLLLVQCNALNKPLPAMFERMGSYTEMLLPNNILHQESVIGHMVLDIPEEDWLDQVQIIGWLYQFYISELKAKVDKKVQDGGKVEKTEMPAKTQLFTPAWIVRYMVENSLGRLWIEGHPNKELRSCWKYYLDEAKQEPEVEEQLFKIYGEYARIQPEEIKIIDPCMGSGHILVYVFDVLMQIYLSMGRNQREAVQSIVKNNLYGFDIDDRAAQLAYFAVMMKACQYDRRFLVRVIQPNVYSIKESNNIQPMVIEYFHKGDLELKAAIEGIVSEMRDAKEYGSILNVSPVNFSRLYERFSEINEDNTFMQKEVVNDVLPLVKCVEILTQKYDVVVTNPPYLGSAKMDDKLLKYVKHVYPYSKGDLFTVFIEKGFALLKAYGYQAMITMHSWMFISTYEKFRDVILRKNVVNMLHLGSRAFEMISGEQVQTVAFVMRNMQLDDYLGKYIRLVDAKSEQEKQQAFLTRKTEYEKKQNDFYKIPGNRVAYWITDTLIEAFKNPTIGDLAKPRQGLATGDNNRFTRLWHELNVNRINFNVSNISAAEESGDKWFPYNKGGAFRRWYGDDDYVVNWKDNGKEIKNFFDGEGKLRSRPQNIQYYFKESITWSLISSSSGNIAFRYKPNGFIFDVAGMSCFSEDKLQYLLALCNSLVVDTFVKIFSSTNNKQVGDVANIPVVFSMNWESKVIDDVNENIDLSKTDWNSYEISWNFKKNLLV